MQMSSRGRTRKGSRFSQPSTSTRRSWSTRKSSRQLRSSDTENTEDRDGFSQLESRWSMKSAQHAKAAEVSFDEQKTSVHQGGSRTEQTDIPAARQRHVLVIQRTPRRVNIPLLQSIDTTVDIPVAKQRREDNTKTA